MTVDESVDTSINISSEWDLPSESKFTSFSEMRVDRKKTHYLTFSPLSSTDTGLYTCEATVNPESGDFVKNAAFKTAEVVDVEREFHESQIQNDSYLISLFCRSSQAHS